MLASSFMQDRVAIGDVVTPDKNVSINEEELEFGKKIKIIFKQRKVKSSQPLYS